MADEDAVRRAAELEALEAIYEGGVEAVSDHEWRLQLSDVDALLEVLLPVDYPSVSAPAPVLRCRDVPADAVERLCAQAVVVCEQTPVDDVATVDSVCIRLKSGCEREPGIGE